MEIDTKEGEKNIWMKKCLLQKHDLSEEWICLQWIMKE